MIKSYRKNAKVTEFLGQKHRFCNLSVTRFLHKELNRGTLFRLTLSFLTGLQKIYYIKSYWEFYTFLHHNLKNSKKRKMYL